MALEILPQQTSRSIHLESIPISTSRNLIGVYPTKQNRNKPKSYNREIVGVDTETDGKKTGDLLVICDSDGNHLDGAKATFENVAEFLLKHSGKIIATWNLGYDVLPILKYLPIQILDQYLSSGKFEYEYNGYRVYYIEDKMLRISKGKKKSVSAYDFAQFYDKQSLESCHAKHFPVVLDEDYENMKLDREKFSKDYYKYNRTAVRRYCIQDCIATKQLAEKWIKIFTDTFQYTPSRWISSGYLAERILLLKMKQPFPLYSDIDPDIQELARKCQYGGRFEQIIRGNIKFCWIWDINSAYPYAMTQIPDLLDGKWINSKKINPKARVGFFHIYTDIDSTVKIAPFPFRNKRGRIVYHSGNFETWVTLHEILAVQGDPRIKYRILDSWQFIPNENCSYPFRDVVTELYLKRLEKKRLDDPQQQALKIILNSFYGKTAQVTEKKKGYKVYGNLFFPAIAATITGIIRAQLYKFVKDNNLENDVVAFATDSIALKKEIKLDDSLDLGAWKLDKKADDAYFIGNGYYRMNGEWKQRGVGKDPGEKNASLEHKESIEKDGQYYIIVKRKRPVKLRKAIRYKKHMDIAKFVEEERHIDLNSDRKRFWYDGELTSIDDPKICDSWPLDVNMIDESTIALNDVEWDDDNDDIYIPESEL